MKWHTTILSLIFIFMMASEGKSMYNDRELADLLPGNTGSVTVQSENVYTTAEELYDYINGGAELYLNYGFKKLARRIYTFEEDNEIKAEIFDMSLPKNAFGVFSYSKDTSNMDIGQGAQYIGGSLIFWQDHYFVSIFAQNETGKTKEEMLKMGRKISDAIGTTGELPGIFQTLPERSLVKGSTFYFHHHAWQNRYRYISNDNIFNIDDDVDALLNQYGDKENRYYLLVVEYPDKKKARKALKKGRKNFSKILKRERIAQDEDGLWMGCDVQDQLLIFAVDAPSRGKAEYLLDQTAENHSNVK